MYTETRNNFSIRDVILQFLFVALFVFILIWLFPMKSDMKKAIASIDTSNNTDLSLFYDQVFNDNVISMKEAAKSYFTTSRLPQKVGDSVKMTLGEMLEAKIILPFVDKNGDQCSLTGSYVEITKKGEEFVMKVNLKCGDQENYLLVHMGCYDYCSETICEKEQKDVKKPVLYSAKTKKKVNTTKKTTIKKVTTVENKVTIKNEVNIENKVEEDKKEENIVTPEEPKYETLYEYKKITDGTTSYTDWSEWSTNAVTASNDVEVKYKKTQVKKLVAYKKTTSNDYTKPIYETKQVPIASKNVTSCTKYNVTSTITGYKETYLGMVKLTSVPTSTETVRYEKVGTYNWYCDGDCTSGTVYVYKMYQRTPVTSTSYSCAQHETKTSVILGNRTVITGYEKKTTTEPVYEYSTRTYYSYRTKITTPGKIDLKWSKYNDTSLLNSGYVYTGNSKTTLVK